MTMLAFGDRTDLTARSCVCLQKGCPYCVAKDNHPASRFPYPESESLILLYPRKTRQDNSERIEQIRRMDRQTFQQTSVLRADRRCERVGF